MFYYRFSFLTNTDINKSQCILTHNFSDRYILCLKELRISQFEEGKIYNYHGTFYRQLATILIAASE